MKLHTLSAIASIGTLSLALVQCSDHSPKLVRDNRLAHELGVSTLKLSDQEANAGLAYVAGFAKFVPHMPPYGIQGPQYKSLAHGASDLLERLNKELTPGLAVIGTKGDSAKLREAAQKLLDTVRYCYRDDLTEAGSGPPGEEVYVRLLRLDHPPATMTEAADGILEVCADFGDLCSPGFADKVMALKKRNTK